MKKQGTHWWGSPYTFSEKVDFLKYRILSPKESSEVKAPEGMHPLVSDYTFMPSSSEKGREVSIIFTGDLMPFGDTKPSHSMALEQFLASADYIVFNLEGVVTDQRRFLALSHSHTPLYDYLHTSFGRRVILNVANNHASDFGSKAFSLQNQWLRDQGFLVIGDTLTPLTIEGQITLSARTLLSNQPPIIEMLSLTHPSISHEWRLLQKSTVSQSCLQDCPDFAARMKRKTLRVRSEGSIHPYVTEAESRKQHSDAPLCNSLEWRPPQHTYNIFMPHWGYEMHLSPTQEQIALYHSVVPAIYDSLIGNHAHTPQPVYLSESTVLATSLGNYCYRNHNPNHWMGSLLKCTFTIQESSNTKPALARVELRHTIQHITRSRLQLDLVDAIDYSTLRKATNFYRWGYLKDLLK